MKLSNYNRLCAISRCDEYVSDLVALLDLFDKTKTDNIDLYDKYRSQLCEKWNLKKDILPQLVKSDKQYFIENDQEPILDVDKNAMVNINAYIYLIKHIQIDMRKSKLELRRAFAKKIEEWSKQYLQEKSNKKTEYDPWEVYDLYLVYKNYSEVARRISGLSGNATYNVKLKKCREKVVNAHKRALDMIKAVKPTTYLKPLFR